MSTAESRAAIDRYNHAQNHGPASAVGAVVAERYLRHEPAVGWYNTEDKHFVRTSAEQQQSVQQALDTKQWYPTQDMVVDGDSAMLRFGVIGPKFAKYPRGVPCLNMYRLEVCAPCQLGRRG